MALKLKTEEMIRVDMLKAAQMIKDHDTSQQIQDASLEEIAEILYQKFLVRNGFNKRN